MNDTRNVVDEFKGMSEADIITKLDENGIELEIAIENVERDFNMGTIVRSANAFGVRRVHVIGRKQWNKRGAMATDKYLHVEYYGHISEFASAMQKVDRTIVAVDNIDSAIDLSQTALPKKSVLVFGAEGPGISSALASVAAIVVKIEQFGSTRSLNVGVAAGIVMYEWLNQNQLYKNNELL